MTSWVGSGFIAEHMACTTRTVERWAEAGLIPSAELWLGRWRFDKAKIRRWLNRKAVKA